MRRHAQRRGKVKSDKGIVLLIVLWILVILSLLAVGIGRKASVDLSLAKYYVGKLKSDHLARAGVHYAMQKIQEDAKDPVTAAVDTLVQCGVKLEEGQAPQEVFARIPLGEGYFNIGYTAPAETAQSPLADSAEKKFYYGFADEERRVNINALGPQDYRILKYLMIGMGVEESLAEEIAAATLDWKDPDSDATNSPQGAEDEYYKGLTPAYGCKNMPFESLEEVLLVKKMTPEIFEKIKNFITIYPKESGIIKININTAPTVVIEALGYNIVDYIPNFSREDVASMTEKIIRYRQGSDEVPMTEDDQPVDLTRQEDLNLTTPEQTMFLNVRGRLTAQSRYFRIEARGVDETSAVASTMETVVDARDLSILYWKKG